MVPRDRAGPLAKGVHAADIRCEVRAGVPTCFRILWRNGCIGSIMQKNKEINCLHEAAHAAYALELGFRDISMAIGNLTSRNGLPLLGVTAYRVEDPAPIPEYDYLLKRAIIACAGSAVVGFATGQDPFEIMKEEADDKDSIAEFSAKLRELALSEEQIKNWLVRAWNTANHLAPEYFPRIRVLARALFESDSMNEEQIKRVWDNSKVRAVIIGTRHELQRHQDSSEDREKIRTEFESLLSRVIRENNASLITEEAGDDNAVWKLLKQEEQALGEFAEAFGGGRTVDAPVSTIAKILSDKHAEQIRYADIRVDADKLPLVDQRDEAMTAMIMEVRGNAEDILVIVGEVHRVGITQRLANKGIAVESFRFPKTN